MNCKLALVVLALSVGLSGLAATEWPERLWLGRGGFWTARVGFAVSNVTDRAVQGEPVALRVGTGKDELPLAGVRVGELRLVDARGVELLYGVRTVDGELLREGTVPADAEVTIPFCAAAKECARYFFYYGNASAWALADFLEVEAGGWNGGFERGVKKPSGWTASGVDETHLLGWDEAVRAEGRRALRAVASGKRSWFGWRHETTSVVPGSTFVIRVKVKAENVKGDAGWFVHVGNDTNPMVVNKTVSAGGGSYGWRSLEIKVKVPEGCTKLATGSTLWGEGRAWYDEFSFASDCPSAKPVTTVGKVERLAVRNLGTDDPWPASGDWEYRVPIRVANFSDADVASSLTSFGLREAVRGVRNAEWKLFLDGRETDACRTGETVLFSCAVPARTIRTCWLYVRSGAAKPAATKPNGEVRSALGSAIPSDQVLVTRTEVGDEAALARLIASSANLVRNPTFAEGANGWRHTAERAASPIRYEVTTAGGRFGGGFAKMAVPRTEGGRWRGWYQSVPVKPGKSYYFGGFVSGEGLSSDVRIYAHAHARDGRTTQMMSTADSIAGAAPWTPCFGVCTAGSDDATLELHLTTDGSGALAYDGILVAEFLRAVVGDLEARPAGTDGALAVEAVDPVVKVFRETRVRNGGAFAVALARNETEPLQLAVRSPRAARLVVEVTPPRLADGRGGVAVETGVVGYVPVDYATAYYNRTTPDWELKYPTHNAASDGWSGWWPDPIAPTNVCELAANETGAVWINVKTDGGTTPGVYRGRIVWREAGRIVRTDDYAVTVWNFALPAVAEIPAVYDLRMGARWADDVKGLSADERRRLFLKFYSEKRICPDSVNASVRFARDAEGRVTADFAEYDRLATEYFEEFKFPVSYTPGTFYCFGWGMPPKAFLGEEPYEGKWPFEGADRSQLRPAYRKAYQDALRLYWNHVKAKGWDKKIVLYISDEPHFSVKAVKDQMIALCRMIHEVDPAIRVYSSTWRHCPEWNDSLDVWGVGHYGAFPVAEMKSRAAAGKHSWFTTDGQMCLDTPYCAVERLLPHYSIAYDAEAYEFWGATWLTYDPWQYGWHSYIRQSDTPGKFYSVRYPDGDGYLMYPGVPGRFKGPVSSVRLEAARDGVEDFSYLKALRRLAASADGRAARAKALLADFAALVTIPNPGGRYSSRILPEPERLGELRRRAGELLSAILWQREPLYSAR